MKAFRNHLLALACVLSIPAILLADSIEVDGRALRAEGDGRLASMILGEERLGVGDAIRNLEGPERLQVLVDLYIEAWRPDVRETILGQNTRSAVLAMLNEHGGLETTSGTLLLLHAARDTTFFFDDFAASNLWRGSEDLSPEIEAELLRLWRSRTHRGVARDYVRLNALRSLSRRFPNLASSLVPEALEAFDSSDHFDRDSLAGTIVGLLPTEQALDLIEARALGGVEGEDAERDRRFLFGLWVLQKQGKLATPALRERVWQVYTNALASDSLTIRATALYSIATWHGQLLASGETVPVPESFIAAVERCNRNPGDEEQTRSQKSLAYWRQHRATP